MSLLHHFPMRTFKPQDTAVIVESGLPTNESVGFQVVNAATGNVAIPRTTIGIVERPTGSGAYVVTFVAPITDDIFLLIVDWNGGALDPLMSRVTEFQVKAGATLGETELGAIADYTKVNLGGNAWRGLNDVDGDFGPDFVVRAIEIVKARAFAVPPTTDGESMLPALVLDYLGICVALELVPALRDYWGSAYISVSSGDDPTEIVTYPNRVTMMKEVKDDLLSRLTAAQKLALPLITSPVALIATDLPAIDEDYDDARVTGDPRTFPREEEFGRAVDPLGRRLRSGVRL